MKEIHFLFDDKLDEYLKGINGILTELEKVDFETRQKEVVLRTFTKAIIKSLMKPRPAESRYVQKQEYKPLTRTYAVTQKRLVHVPAGADVWPIPQPTPEEAKSVSIKEFKLIPRYAPRIVQSTEIKERPIAQEEIYKPKIELQPQVIDYPLVVEPETNKALALAQVSLDYKVLEPLVTDKDIDLINEVKSRIKNNPKKFIDDDKKLTKIMTKFCNNLGITYSEDYKRKIKYYLIRDLIYFGKVDPLLRDTKINKIICDGPGTPVIIEYESRTLSTNVIFKEGDKLNELIKDIALKLNQKISDAEPILDAVYKDYKIQATLGTAFSTPKFTIIRQKDMNIIPPRA